MANLVSEAREEETVAVRPVKIDETACRVTGFKIQSDSRPFPLFLASALLKPDQNLHEKGYDMLDGHFARGFSPERLASIQEPKVRKDAQGYYIMSLSENCKVYFEDFYTFLETTYDRCKLERERLTTAIAGLNKDQTELASFYRGRAVIIDLLMRTVRRFYTDGANLGVIMTPWCFGTVVLEKVEVYRDRLSRGEAHDQNIAEYPFYVLKYIDEIYKATLLELFDFPEQAFQMRWQYSELLKRYSGALTNISNSLQSVLLQIKNYGA